jgi:hypothetical protein
MGFEQSPPVGLENILSLLLKLASTSSFEGLIPLMVDLEWTDD